MSSSPASGIRLSNVIGIDDGAFSRHHRGDVPIIGTIYAGLRFDGVAIGRVRRDGANAARQVLALISGSRFHEHLQLIFLNGITFGGFNVVDIHHLHRELGLPVLVVTRHPPNFASIRKALLERVPGGRRKWKLIEQAGQMEEMAGVQVQRVGIGREAAEHVVSRFAINGLVPEPLRVAHLIGGAVTLGQSRGRA